MFTSRNVEVKLLSYGPRTKLKIDDRDFQVEPDLLIALEGVGTFRGVTLEERLQDFLRVGKDPEKMAFKMHQESTRRGHASLTTSLTLQLEVNICSRVASMLLVSPPIRISYNGLHQWISRLIWIRIWICWKRCFEIHSRL